MILKLPDALNRADLLSLPEPDRGRTVFGVDKEPEEDEEEEEGFLENFFESGHGSFLNAPRAVFSFAGEDGILEQRDLTNLMAKF